jgi:hypothetical protein
MICCGGEKKFMSMEMRKKKDMFFSFLCYLFLIFKILSLQKNEHFLYILSFFLESMYKKISNLRESSSFSKKYVLLIKFKNSLYVKNFVSNVKKFETKFL